MRTTVRLDDDVYRAAKSMAESRGSTIGAILSELARRGLQDTSGIRYEDDLPVFEVREGAPLITSDLVHELLDDDG